MSSKYFKQLLQQASALDEFGDSDVSKKRQKKKRILSATDGGDEKIEKSAMQTQIDSMLYFDKAFSNRTDTVNASLNRRQKEADKKRRARKKANSSVGNSRSSSSVHAKNAHIPTFNRKRHLKQKKIKDLQDLAKMLKANK